MRTPEKSGLLPRVVLGDGAAVPAPSPLPEGDEARESTQLEDELLAVIGHDLRSPLSVVMMTADALARSAKDEPAHAMARRLRSAGDRILRTIDELMALGRVRQGVPLALDLAPSDVGAICASVVADLAAAHPGRVTFEAEAGDLTAEVDLGKVTRSVESLVVRALRQTKKKDPVAVKAGEDGDAVVVTVWTPAVLDEAALERVFEPFGTTPDGRVRSDGASLGVFVAREVALAHGGSADVSAAAASADEPGGTTFRRRRPRRRA